MANPERPKLSEGETTEEVQENNIKGPLESLHSGYEPHSCPSWVGTKRDGHILGADGVWFPLILG